MLDHERVAIEADCNRLAHAFCQHSDANRADLYEALFTVDARFVRLGSELRTARAIAGALTDRAPTILVRHLCANAIVQVEGPNRARGAGNLMVVRHDRSTDVTQPAVFGDYRDEYVRTDEGWKIAFREVQLSFGDDERRMSGGAEVNLGR